MQRLPPGGADDLAAHVAGVLGGQEYVQLRELAGLARAAERGVGPRCRRARSGSGARRGYSGAVSDTVLELTGAAPKRAREVLAGHPEVFAAGY